MKSRDALHGAGARPADAPGASRSPGGGQGRGGPFRTDDGRGTKRLALLLAAACIAGLAALAAAVPDSPEPRTGGPSLPPPPPSGHAPAAGQAATGGTPQNEFAFNLYRAASAGAEGGGNMFISPLSVRTAFSVLYEGAGGRTAQQISDALDIDGDPDIRRGEARHTADSLAGRNDSSKIALANALWVDDEFSLHGAYLEAARGAYNASVGAVDFADAAGAARRINEWASDSTNGLIKDAIAEGGIGGSTAMAITNAIYFKGGWALPFPKHKTQEGPFTRGDGTPARAEFMTVTGTFGHVAYDGYQVLRIPYKGDRLSMLVVLPDDAGGLGRVAGGLSSGALGAWLDDMAERKLLVTIPKFTVEARYDLKQALTAMGVTDVFDRNYADLQGIGVHESGLPLYVGNAEHAA